MTGMSRHCTNCRAYASHPLCRPSTRALPWSRVRRWLSDESPSTGETGTGRRPPFHRVRACDFQRPALHHVADVNVFAHKWNAFTAGGVFDHLRQQLARAADKRHALRVFIRARVPRRRRRFRLRIACAEDDFLPPPGFGVRQRLQSPMSSRIFSSVSFFRSQAGRNHSRAFTQIWIYGGCEIELAVADAALR